MISIRLISVLTLAVAVSGLACGRKQVETSILVVTFDSLRADSVYERPQDAPNLVSLMAVGAHFSRAFAPAPWTLPSLVSLLTGLSPFSHGVRDPNSAFPSNAVSLPELLGRLGFDTAVVGYSPFFGPEYRLTDGFDHSEVFWKTVSPEGDISGRRRPLVSTKELTDRAVAWLRSRDRRRTFLWVHYYDPHLPYTPPSEWLSDDAPGSTDFTEFFDPNDEAFQHSPGPDARNRARELYQAELRYADSQFGRLLEVLRELGRYHDSLIIATSDHGEEFWEHGDFAHGRSLFDEVLQIPLIVKLPGDRHERTVHRPVSLESIVPTILSVVQPDAGNSEFPAQSLGTIIGHPTAEPQAGALLATSVMRGEDQVAVRLGRWKYIAGLETGRVRLFDIESDPKETTDLSAREPDALSELRDVLHDTLRSHAILAERMGIEVPSLSENPERLERLRDLGYLQ